MTSKEFAEIPDASRSHITTEFQQLLASNRSQHITLDTINISLAKFQAFYTRGISSTFPSRDFFSYIIGRDIINTLVVPGTYDEAKAARDAVDGRFIAAFFWPAT